MALIIPILFTILFGIIIFGMLLSYRQNLAQAAAEGARAGAVAPALPGRALSDAQQAVNDAVSSFGQTCGNGKLTCTILPPTTCANNPSVSCITVTLTLSSSQAIPDIPLVGIFLPNTISATSVAEVS